MLYSQYQILNRLLWCNLWIKLMKNGMNDQILLLPWLKTQRQLCLYITRTNATQESIQPECSSQLNEVRLSRKNQATAIRCLISRRMCQVLLMQSPKRIIGTTRKLAEDYFGLYGSLHERSNQRRLVSGQNLIRKRTAAYTIGHIDRQPQGDGEFITDDEGFGCIVMQWVHEGMQYNRRVRTLKAEKTLLTVYPYWCGSWKFDIGLRTLAT